MLHYQIKADDTGSNMVANLLPTDTPSTQGVGSNFNGNRSSPSNFMSDIEYSVIKSDVIKSFDCIKMPTIMLAF